jgi:methylglyoxal synthase
MEHSIIKLGHKKRIALIAHDNKKQDLLEWAKWNKTLLAEHELFATGTTGKLLEEVLGTPVEKFQSGPLGGDQQIGAKISEGLIDFMIFFWDPLTEQPHDADVKALLRIAVVWNIPVACNRATADFLISSTLMTGEYDRLVTDYEAYRERQVGALVGNKMEPAKEPELESAVIVEIEMDSVAALGVVAPDAFDTSEASSAAE